VLSFGRDRGNLLELENMNRALLGSLSYSYTIVEAMRFDLLLFEELLRAALIII
jgi:hypothetical protein